MGTMSGASPLPAPAPWRRTEPKAGADGRAYYPPPAPFRWSSRARARRVAASLACAGLIALLLVCGARALRRTTAASLPDALVPFRLSLPQSLGSRAAYRPRSHEPGAPAAAPWSVSRPALAAFRPAQRLALLNSTRPDHIPSYSGHHLQAAPMSDRALLTR